MIALFSLCLAGLVTATLVHELGHLAAGLALRCDPRLMSIGVGPALVRRRVGGVWLVLRALPVGGYVLLPPRPEERRFASLGVTAAGPAANLAALLVLLAAWDRLPDAVAFMASYAQGVFLAVTLLPTTMRAGGVRWASDGRQMLSMLAGRPRHRLRAMYAEAVARMQLGDAAPAMTPAFAEIVLQQTRLDRLEPWGRRQAIDALEDVVAGPAANAMERALARAVLHGTVDAEQEAFRRERRATPASAGEALTGHAVAGVAETAPGNLTTWLWVAVLVVAVVGPIYDYRRRSDGEEGRLDAAQLRFDLYREQVGGHRVVSLGGTIGGDAIVELREAIARYGLGSGDTLLLDSPGGDLGNAAVMGRIIRRHGLATEVGALRGGRIVPADCASACVALFAAGTRRVLPEGSRIGIHTFRSVDDGGRTDGEIERSARATERREVEYFAEMGVAPELEESAAKVSPDDIHWLTPEETLDVRLATARGDAG